LATYRFSSLRFGIDDDDINRFFAELKQAYSAINRSVNEYCAAFSQALEPAYAQVSEGPLFGNTRNCKETIDFYFLSNRR
jgi:hypothetical protein